MQFTGKFSERNFSVIEDRFKIREITDCRRRLVVLPIALRGLILCRSIILRRRCLTVSLILCRLLVVLLRLCIALLRLIVALLIRLLVSLILCVALLILVLVRLLCGRCLLSVLLTSGLVAAERHAVRDHDILVMLDTVLVGVVVVLELAFDKDHATLAEILRHEFSGLSPCGDVDEIRLLLLTLGVGTVNGN